MLCQIGAMSHFYLKTRRSNCNCNLWTTFLCWNILFCQNCDGKELTKDMFISNTTVTKRTQSGPQCSIVRRILPENVNSHFGDVLWRNYFLWGHLRLVYIEKSLTLQDLKDCMTRWIWLYNINMMERQMWNFQERLQHYIVENGNQMHDVIFRTCYYLITHLRLC